jgi:hypothetical protein
VTVVGHKNFVGPTLYQGIGLGIHPWAKKQGLNTATCHFPCQPARCGDNFQGGPGYFCAGSKTESQDIDHCASSLDKF